MQPILTTHNSFPTLTQLDMNSIRQTLRDAQHEASKLSGNKPTRTLSFDENEDPSNQAPSSSPTVAKRTKSTLVLSLAKHLRSLRSIVQQPPSARSSIGSMHGSKLSLSVDDLSIGSCSDNEKENDSLNDSNSEQQSKKHRRRSSSLSYPSSIEHEMRQSAMIKKLQNANSQLMLERSRDQTTYQAVISEKDREMKDMRITIQSLKVQIFELEKRLRDQSAKQSVPSHRSNQLSQSSDTSSCSGSDALSALLDEETQPNSPSDFSASSSVGPDDVEISVCDRVDQRAEDDTIDVVDEPATPRANQAPEYPLMTPNSSPVLTPGRLAKFSESFNDSLIGFKILPSTAQPDAVQPATGSFFTSPSSKNSSMPQLSTPSASRATSSTPRSKIPEFVSPARRTSQQTPTQQTPRQSSSTTRRQSLIFSECRTSIKTPQRTPRSEAAVLSNTMPAVAFSVLSDEPAVVESSEKSAESVQAAWVQFQAKKKKSTRAQTDKTVSQTPESKRRRETIASTPVAEDDTKIIQRSVSQPQPISHQRSDTVVGFLRSNDAPVTLIPSVQLVATIPFTAAEGKKFQQDVRRHRSTLHLSNDWTIRAKGLNSIEELARSNRASIPVWNDWAKELEQLRPSLIEQVSDLRSSIVREACKCLLALCEASPVAFEREFEQYLPYLAKGLYVTIKVIKDSSDDCLNGLVAMLSSQRVLVSLIALLTDIHAVVREKCIGYITLIVENPLSAPVVDACASDLQSMIVKYCQDGDAATRGACRNLYRIFTLKFSARASVMETSLPSAVRKALETDNKLKKASKTTKTTKKSK